MNRYFHFHGQLSNFEIVCLSPSEQKGKLRAGLVTQKGKKNKHSFDFRFRFSLFCRQFPFFFTGSAGFPNLMKLVDLIQFVTFSLLPA